MTDPRLNETVTYVAEMDLEREQEELRKTRKIVCLLVCILLPLFCLPCAFILPLFLYAIMDNNFVKLKQAQIYITDSTLVWINPFLREDIARTTVPLADIATTTTDSNNLVSVNIKPTAPQVILNRGNSQGETYATRCIPLAKIKNPSEFADAVQQRNKF